MPLLAGITRVVRREQRLRNFIDLCIGHPRVLFKLLGIGKQFGAVQLLGADNHMGFSIDRLQVRQAGGRCAGQLWRCASLKQCHLVAGRIEVEHARTRHGFILEPDNQAVKPLLGLQGPGKGRSTRCGKSLALRCHLGCRHGGEGCHAKRQGSDDNMSGFDLHRYFQGWVP